MQQTQPPLRIHSALAGEILDRVAGNEADQREREQRHAEKRRHDQRDATEDECEHGSGCADGAGTGFRVTLRARTRDDATVSNRGPSLAGPLSDARVTWPGRSC